MTDTLVTGASPPRCRGTTAVVAIVAALAVFALAKGVTTWGAANDPGAVRNVGTGSLTAALSWPEGTPLFTEVFSITDADSDSAAWYVLDAKGHQIHRIGPKGLIATFGGWGEGPGELKQPSALTVHHDTVVVLEGATDWKLYSLTGKHLADRSVKSFWICTPMVLVDMVSTPRGLLLLAVCPMGAYQQAHVILEKHDGYLSHLTMIQTGSQRGREMDATFYPVLARHPSGFVFGSAGDNCLQLYDLRGRNAGDDICHEWMDARQPPADWERTQLRIARRMRRAGIRIDWGELPKFEAVDGTESGALLYRTGAPGTEEGLRVLTRTGVGEQFELATPHGRHLFMAARRFMVAWDDMQGARILTGTVELPGDE